MGRRSGLWLGLAVCFSVVPAFGADICSRTPAEFQRMILDPDNRLAFQNDGGLLDGGVCWWHSRFQRAANYLAVFRPDRPKPTEDEAFRLALRLTQMNRVVEIPGYANLYEFSSDFEQVIQERLEFWQAWDGFVNQAWIRGLAGSTHMRAKKMAARMDRLYQEVEGSHRIVFQMLQLKGITSHSWLVAGMTRILNGYQLHVVDSNAPLVTRTFLYRYGDTTIYSPSFKEYFVPYRGFTRDLRKIFRTIREYCNKVAAN
ncbi:MAG: hypothetical protein HYW49_11920 [Deltaproteobacteria bacterium]|nr:hypothetical protein [Deltaproteobacteria bacterium]